MFDSEKRVFLTFFFLTNKGSVKSARLAKAYPNTIREKNQLLKIFLRNGRNSMVFANASGVCYYKENV